MAINKFVMGEIRLIQGKFGSVFMSRHSMLTGKFNMMCIGGVTVEEIAEWLLSRNPGQQGQLIQDAFPHLNAVEREFIMTGITESEWKSSFGKPEVEEA